MSGAICGGVISETMWSEDFKKYGVWANAMAYVMPDHKYKEYVALIKNDKQKEATELFDKYAVSQI